MTNEIEELINKFGEQYRDLITHSIEWLIKEEPLWKLKEPINKEKYIEDLISHLAPEKLT